MGSWENKLLTGDLTWSDKLYEIFGLSKGNPLNVDSLTEQILPEDGD